MEIELSTVFEQAAKLLERDGWVQGNFTLYDESGVVRGRCVAGAVRAVIYNDDDDWGDAVQGTFSRALYALNDTVARVSGGTAWAVTTWNDEEGRTADEAITLLRKASQRMSTMEMNDGD